MIELGVGPIESGLIDTSVVVDLALLDPVCLPQRCLISAVTLAELGLGPLLASSPQVRAARQAHLQQAEADFEVLAFDSSCARAFARVAFDLRLAGRKASARSYDALIAATAMAFGLPLYTLNPEDFAGINNLDLKVPHFWSVDQAR